MSQNLDFKKIPLSKIMPNFDQPRRMFKPGSTQSMAESLLAVGQQTLAKVRRLTDEEKASYSYFDYEWPVGTTAPKKSNGEFGFEYMMIGGHRRLAGAKLAAFETLDCVIMDVAPEDTHLASLMDNSNVEMSWWDWDLAIEKEHLLHPNLSQRELAKRLGVSKSKVNNALKILAVLNKLSRGSIDMNLDKVPLDGDFHPPTSDQPQDVEGDPVQTLDKTKPDYEITEYVLLALADLEDPAYVSDTLDIIIDNKMNLGLAKKLIEFVMNGGEPEAFDPKKASTGKEKEEDPFAEDWKGLGKDIKVKHKGGEDYEIKLAVTGGEKAFEIVQAAQRTLEGGLVERLSKIFTGMDNPKS